VCSVPVRRVYVLRLGGVNFDMCQECVVLLKEEFFYSFIIISLMKRGRFATFYSKKNPNEINSNKLSYKSQPMSDPDSPRNKSRPHSKPTKIIICSVHVCEPHTHIIRGPISR